MFQIKTVETKKTIYFFDTSTDSENYSQKSCQQHKFQYIEERNRNHAAMLA